MIAGIFHQGSGLGNQLHRYIATKTLALDKGYDFGMLNPSSFKGISFMNLDMGSKDSSFYRFSIESSSGKLIPDKEVWEEKTNYYNPEFNFIEDNTIIDGEFQDERYFVHRLKEIDEWLKVEPIEIPDDVCVIGFRGGEYALYPELFLTREYWDTAIAKMREINPNMRFEIHTDDIRGATFHLGGYLKDTPIIHAIGINWRSMRYAKYAIIANSSFYILPRLLRQRESEGRVEIITGHAVTIAPRYWARRNTKEWSMPQNYYKSFKYI